MRVLGGEAVSNEQGTPVVEPWGVTSRAWPGRGYLIQGKRSQNGGVFRGWRFLIFEKGSERFFHVGLGKYEQEDRFHKNLLVLKMRPAAFGLRQGLGLGVFTCPRNREKGPTGVGQGSGFGFFICPRNRAECSMGVGLLRL